MKEIKVLLIDDNEADYEIIKQKLKKINNFNFNLDWENNFENGKKSINSRKYDIILLDTLLKDGNGLDLLKYARESNNTKPIIIITGMNNVESDQQALQYGADDYVIKSDLSDTSLERSLRYSYERFQTKLEISQREERYRNLFEKSLDAVAIIDNELNLIEMNQSMSSLTNIKLSKLTDRSIKQFFVNEKDFGLFKEMIENWGIIKKYETSLQNIQGEKILAEITSIVLFDLKNQISGYQIIIKDLTKEKLNGQRLIRAEKLGMTGCIARSIAHEVRNPLTNINLAIEQLKEDIPSTESNDMYIDIVNRNSHRINKLITELLNSSKPNNVLFSQQSIKKVLLEAIELALDRINLKGIKLKTKIEKDFTLNYDFIQLKTAILNIIINAIEAMEENNGVLEVTLDGGLDELQITIKDNGIGMKPDTLNQLFDPFFTGKPSGMGLGMTSTQNIIHQHKGSIDVTSEPGKGTSFIINLPK